MPFQAIAWAWNVDLSDPVERCALIWVAGRCTEGDWLVQPFDVRRVSIFAGVNDIEADLALDALAEKGLIDISLDRQSVCVRLPSLGYERVALDNSEPIYNRAPLDPALKGEVIRAYERACFACGSKLDPHVDHIIPRYLGGPNTRENLQVLCGDCNRRKGRRTSL